MQEIIEPKTGSPMREVITPRDEAHWLDLRMKDITSTEISALFGCSPYQTAFELWHRKKAGVHVAFEETERMRWGTRLEPAIAEGVGADLNVAVRPMKEYIRLADFKIGSSFDFVAGYENGLGLLEIKNVDPMQFKDGWVVNDDGSLEAPLHIELQVQHQLLVSGFERAKIAALVGGNRVVILDREPDDAIHESILREAYVFWRSIEASRPPEPNFERDAQFIIKQYQDVAPGKVVDADEEIEQLANEYREAGAREKEAAVQKAAAKAQLLTRLGDAEKCKGSSFSISAGVVSPTHISYDRDGYRDFRISWRKKK